MCANQRLCNDTLLLKPIVLCNPMPKRIYTTEEKKLVRRLLLIHQGDVNAVRYLTGFPERTIYNWRRDWDDDYELFADALAKNAPALANANPDAQAPSNPVAAGDSPLAETPNSLAEYTQLRRTLMEHANTLADTLLLGDGLVHQRVQAVSRLLDRILALDEILPAQQPKQETDLQPEQTMRWEFVYDGGIHDVPPWEKYDVSTPEGSKRSAENYLRGMKKTLEQNLADDFPDVYGDCPVSLSIDEADIESDIDLQSPGENQP